MDICVIQTCDKSLAIKVTHEDFPLPVGPIIAFNPGFIMPLKKVQKTYMMGTESYTYIEIQHIQIAPKVEYNKLVRIVASMRINN